METIFWERGAAAWGTGDGHTFCGPFLGLEKIIVVSRYHWKISREEWALWQSSESRVNA